MSTIQLFGWVGAYLLIAYGCRLWWFNPRDIVDDFPVLQIFVICLLWPLVLFAIAARISYEALINRDAS